MAWSPLRILTSIALTVFCLGCSTAAWAIELDDTASAPEVAVESSVSAQDATELASDVQVDEPATDGVTETVSQVEETANATIDEGSGVLEETAAAVVDKGAEVVQEAAGTAGTVEVSSGTSTSDVTQAVVDTTSTGGSEQASSGTSTSTSSGSSASPSSDAQTASDRGTGSSLAAEQSTSPASAGAAVSSSSEQPYLYSSAGSGSGASKEDQGDLPDLVGIGEEVTGESTLNTRASQRNDEQARPAQTPAPQPEPSKLAITGVALGALILAGVVLVLAGDALTMFGRRSRRPVDWSGCFAPAP